MPFLKQQQTILLQKIRRRPNPFWALRDFGNASRKRSLNSLKVSISGSRWQCEQQQVECPIEQFAYEMMGLGFS